MGTKRVDVDKHYLINNYLNGESVCSLSRKLGLSEGTISNRLKEYGIELRKKNPNPNTKIPFDEEFFFTDSDKLYYMLGFALGDGTVSYLSETRAFLQYNIISKDDSILKNFCDWIGLKHSFIKYYRNNYIASFTITRNWIKKLSKYGLVPNKTYYPVVPNIPLEFIKPFIIGLIDADGTVEWRKPRTNNIHPHWKRQYGQTINLIGHPLIMDWVIKMLRLIGFVGNINQHLVRGSFQTNNLQWRRIQIQRKNDIIALCKVLELEKYYYLALPRKWQGLFEEITNLD